MTTAVASIGAQQIASGNSIASVAGTSTAGTFLIALAWFPAANGGANPVGTPTDNKGNTYTQIGTTQTTANGDLSVGFWRCEGGAFGSGHQASAAFDDTDAFANIELIQVNVGTGTAVLDKTAQGNDASVPYALVTPGLSDADEAVVFFLGVDTGTNPGGGWSSSDTTIVHSVDNPASFWPTAVAKVVATSNAAVTGTFTYDAGHNHQSALIAATFKVAAAADDLMPQASF